MFTDILTQNPIPRATKPESEVTSTRKRRASGNISAHPRCCSDRTGQKTNSQPQPAYLTGLASPRLPFESAHDCCSAHPWASPLRGLRENPFQTDFCSAHSGALPPGVSWGLTRKSTGSGFSQLQLALRENYGYVVFKYTAYSAASKKRPW